MEAKTYVLKSSKTVAGVVEAVKNQFYSVVNSGNVQTLQADDGSTIIQMEEKDFVSKIMGMNVALTARIVPIGETNITIEIGHAKWIKKTGMAVVIAALLGPIFMATYAFGAADQLSKPKIVFEAIEAYLNDSPDEKAE